MLHDTHAHLEMLLQKLDILELPDRENFDPEYPYSFPKNILDELLKNHSFVVQATTSTQNFLTVHRLFSHNPKVRFLLGTHPEIVNEKTDVNTYLQEQQDLLKEHGFLQPNMGKDLEIVSPAGNREVIGIGECGLDYHYSQDKEIIRKQWDLFESQISLACFLDLPLIIHTRDSFADTFAILQKFPQIHNKFVFHCFSEGPYELEQVLNFGGRISVGGVVTFKNADKLRSVIDMVPTKKLLIETDLPFLAPMPHRGKTCLPEYIDFVAEKIAEIKSVSKTELWQNLESNTNTFFSR